LILTGKIRDHRGNLVRYQANDSLAWGLAEFPRIAAELKPDNYGPPPRARRIRWRFVASLLAASILSLTALGIVFLPVAIVFGPFACALQGLFLIFALPLVVAAAWYSSLPRRRSVAVYSRVVRRCCGACGYALSESSSQPDGMVQCAECGAWWLTDLETLYRWHAPSTKPLMRSPMSLYSRVIRDFRRWEFELRGDLSESEARALVRQARARASSRSRADPRLVVAIACLALVAIAGWSGALKASELVVAAPLALVVLVLLILMLTRFMNELAIRSIIVESEDSGRCPACWHTLGPPRAGRVPTRTCTHCGGAWASPKS
jgi:hypothetical protein